MDGQENSKNQNMRQGEIVITTDGKNPHFNASITAEMSLNPQEAKETISVFREMFNQAGCQVGAGSYDDGKLKIEASACPVPNAPTSTSGMWATATGVLNMAENAGCKTSLNPFRLTANVICEPDNIAQLGKDLGQEKNPFYKHLAMNLSMLAIPMQDAQVRGSSSTFSAELRPDMSSRAVVKIDMPNSIP